MRRSYQVVKKQWILKMNGNEKNKRVIKQAIDDSGLIMKVAKLDGLHPSTVKDLEYQVHQIQNTLIAEYVRFTTIKDKLKLK